MKCSVVNLPGGGTAIVCGSRTKEKHKCFLCDRPGIRQCDFPVVNDGTEYKTCDKYICSKHATPGGHEIDYCPDHAKARGLYKESNETRASEKPLPSTDDAKWITSKYESQCLKCYRRLKVGDQALWFPAKHSVMCQECGNEVKGEEDQI